MVETGSRTPSQHPWAADQPTPKGCYLVSTIEATCVTLGATHELAKGRNIAKLVNIATIT